MSTYAKVIADSISPADSRLTTLELQYPRFVHAEVMTHRVFSRNGASSRAIPVTKFIDQVISDPAMPCYWGKNQPGMQAREELNDGNKGLAIAEWLNARRSAVEHAEKLVALGVHKQIVNRLLEPFQEMKLIVTATEWDNFYKLRRHPDAQPEIKLLADCMWEAMQNSTPRLLKAGEWHLPYVKTDENSHPNGRLKKWSTARCARVSYLTHDNENPNPEKDETLHDRLLSDGHYSPFEHQATPADGWHANLNGWQSYRTSLGY